MRVQIVSINWVYSDLMPTFFPKLSHAYLTVPLCFIPPSANSTPIKQGIVDPL